MILIDEGLVWMTNERVLKLEQLHTAQSELIKILEEQLNDCEKQIKLKDSIIESYEKLIQLDRDLLLKLQTDVLKELGRET